MNYYWYNGGDGTTTTGKAVGGVVDLSIKGQGEMRMKKEPGMPASIFFNLIKKKMGVLQNIAYKRRMEKLVAMADKATKDGQIAFSEEILKRYFVLARECELYAMGKKIFLSREVYDRFSSKTNRKVRLTKLENYARPIPDDVMQEKAKCDKTTMFDAYFVMHYDSPNVVKETEVEVVAREKDPILFGTVEYSDKLYFVADWEDEYCDLTLDDIVSKLDLEEEDMTLSKNPNN